MARLDKAVLPPRCSSPVGRPGLADAMRIGSSAAHQAAESGEFVRQVLAGQVEATTYLTYVESLRTVYTALESAIHEHRDHPAIAPLHDERLVRLPALEADARHWRGVAGAVGAPASTPATASYTARIRWAAQQPWLLVAHHYTRYLGDLSGGRILQRRLRDQFGADGGLAFYDFDDLHEPVAFKRAYRDRLDRLPLHPAEQEAVVEEVRAVFDCNRLLLADLVPSTS